jgi:hypothetical protein
MWRRVRYVLLLAALCAVATCPSAKRACTAKQESREADALLDYLGDRIEAVVAATGKLPPTAAGPTPQPGCCDHGGTCNPEDISWEAPGWRALEFSVDGEFRYTYQYLPDPSGLSATLRATADLDCDGTAWVDEVKLVIDGSTLTRTRTHVVTPPPSDD